MEFKVLKAQASRRDVIKGTLKGAAYAAPIMVASAIPMAVGAVTGQFGQSLFVNGLNTVTVTSGSFLTFTGRGFRPGQAVFLQIQSLNTGAAIVTGANADGNGNLRVVVGTGGFPLGPFQAIAFEVDPRGANASPLVSLRFNITQGTILAQDNKSTFDPLPEGFFSSVFFNLG